MSDTNQRICATSICDNIIDLGDKPKLIAGHYYCKSCIDIKMLTCQTLTYTIKFDEMIEECDNDDLFGGPSNQ